MYRPKRFKAHVFSYLAFKGKYRAGRVLLHACDNPRCVNPDHLKPGTQSQNVRDCVRKGRHGGFKAKEQST